MPRINEFLALAVISSLRREAASRSRNAGCQDDSNDSRFASASLQLAIISFNERYALSVSSQQIRPFGRLRFLSLATEAPQALNPAILPMVPGSPEILQKLAARSLSNPSTLALNSS